MRKNVAKQALIERIEREDIRLLLKEDGKGERVKMRNAGDGAVKERKRGRKREYKPRRVYE